MSNMVSSKTKTDFKRQENCFWKYCDFNGCKKKFKQTSHLKQHKADVHDIGVVWKYCDFNGCEEKFKQTSHLKRHKADVHDIGVDWKYCDFNGCEEKFKQSGNLKRHKAYVHDIGDYECIYCKQHRNSKIPFKDTKLNKNINICRLCFKKVTGKESRKEQIWSDYIDTHLGKEYLTSSDKSLKSLGGCQKYRPDKMYIGVSSVEICECDEFQHNRKNGNYTCDEKRISDIYEEEGICGKNLYVIRWNPDSYQVPNGQKRKNRNERLKLMVAFQKHMRKNPPKDKIHIYYLFYNKDNERVSRNYPHTFIYSEKDFP